MTREPSSTAANPRGESIGLKLRRLVWRTMAGALATVALATLTVQGWAATRAMTERLSVLAQMVSANVAASLEFGDARQATRLLQSLRSDPDIVAVGVFTTGSERFAGSGTPSGGPAAHSELRDWLQAAMLGRTEARRFSLRAIDHLSPVTLHGEIIGFVHLQASLDRFLLQLLLSSALVIAVALLTGALAARRAALLQERIVEPLFRLAGSMRRVTEQRDFSARVATVEHDEIGQLTDGFNDMLGELEQRDRALGAAVVDANTARASAEAASLAKSRFLSTMSHEIRTPLNGVLGMAELLQHTPLSPEQARYASAISSAGRSLHELLSDILDLAKIEENRIIIEQVDFAPDQLLSEVASVYTELAAASGNTLVTEFDPAAACHVSGDPTRLRQTVINLLGNANKFTQGGTLTLSSQLIPPPPGDVRTWLRVAVQDTGLGIAEPALARLFERFEQADASTTRRFGGTGLGLAICKHLVELMGGHIHAQSTAGEGSRFWFDLPFAAASQPPPRAVARAARAPVRLHGTRVLVAEDNLINQQVISALLTHLGVQPSVAVDGEQAVAAVERQRFDAVLMDCQMPVMDGYEAAARIRAGEAGGRRMPIIALTANALAEDRQRCLAAGMDDYLTKPITGARLAEVLMRHLAAADDSEATACAAPASAGATAAAALGLPGDRRAPDFDPQVLQALPMVADGSRPEFAPAMLRMFEQTSRALLDGIDAALAAGQHAPLQRQLHTLKSSSAQIGALALSQAAARFEAALRAAEPAQPHWVPELRRLQQQARKAWQRNVPPAGEDTAAIADSPARPHPQAPA